MKNFLKRIIPNFLLSWYHFVWAFLGAIIYGFPSKKLKVIGVTGTNGKSTVVFLISRILEQAGYKVAALSSIQFKIKDKIWPNNLKMTMPGRIAIQKFLKQAVQAGCEYVILEVTSEGIKQYRHKFICFDLAVFTNLTKEHIESHGSFENYKKAKGKLFKALKSNGKMIINSDDKNADYFLGFKANEKIEYSLKLAKDIEFSRNGMSFRFKETQFNLNLIGKFNIYNTLAAILVGLSEKIPLDKIKLALENIKGIPGRMEFVVKEPFTVIVDYAHTPDALEKVYETIEESFSGKVIGILGAAGGGRDKWKRLKFGKIAEKYLDKIIITNEDPYNESPQAIIDEIANGLKQKQPKKILDRRQAIHYALESAQSGDVVIITGKGCEPWMCVAKNKKIPWDDREVVRKEIKNMSL